MKVLYIIGTLSTCGGLERIQIEKMNALSAHPDMDVSVICTIQNLCQSNAYTLSPGINQICLGDYTKGKSSLLGKIVSSVKTIVKTLKEINRINPDVIVKAAYIGTFAMLFVRQKVVLESHKVRTRPSKLIERLYIGFLEKKCDVLVALTKEDAALWKAKRVEVIPNFTRIKPVAEYDSNSKRAIAVGRLVQDKGFDILIKAWKTVYEKHPDWRLNIFGDGGLREALQKQIDHSGLHDVVNLKGNTKDIVSEYTSHSIFVLSSRCEGFCLVLLEAMTCGTTCVSFDCPYGPSDLLDNNENGILVPFDSDDDQRVRRLADGICKAIDAGAEGRQIMGQAASVKVKVIDFEHIMQKWIALFESLTNKKN